MYFLNKIVILIFFIVHCINCENENFHSDGIISKNQSNFVKYNTIQGRIFFSSDSSPLLNLESETRIIVNYGSILAFTKKDGRFEINNVPPGSYIVDVANPNYLFEPTRIDINSKGKIRARKINYIQTNVVQQISYPLKFKPKINFKYFQIRESWRITDFLLNPMVLMMVLPLLLIMVLPKMMNVADPEAQKEIQNLQMPKYDIPELSEMMTTFFNKDGGQNKIQNEKSKTKICRKKYVK